MATVVTITLCATPVASAASSPTPTGHLSRPEPPRELTGEQRAVHPERAVGVGVLPQDRVRFWDAVARCETGGNWHMHGSRYSGGVGFYNGTWTWWAGELGLGKYAYADQAPRMTQMAVAEYGLRRHGGYWGCLQ